MAEETASRNEETSEESQEDENQDIWEQQQMRRKAVKSIEGKFIDRSQAVTKFDTSISFPPLHLEIIKKQLNTRLTLLQDAHCSLQRGYEKCVQNIESSTSTIQNLESSSNHALSYKFYRSMKTYVENLFIYLFIFFIL
jgi:GC-rich sequence DNA-binding factor